MLKGFFLLPPRPHTGSGGVYGGAGLQNHTDYLTRHNRLYRQLTEDWQVNT